MIFYKTLKSDVSISLDVGFEGGPFDETTDTGIARIFFRIKEMGDVSNAHFIQMALDYVPRLHWAFDAQNKLYLLFNLIDIYERQRISTVGLESPGTGTSGSSRQTIEELLLSWCHGIPVIEGEMGNFKLGIRYRASAEWEYGRMLQNPIRFPHQILNRVTFNEHLESLHLLIALTLSRIQDENVANEFETIIENLFNVCRDKSGFWNSGKHGIRRSMEVVDELYYFRNGR